MTSQAIKAVAAAMPVLDAEAQRRADEARQIQLAQGLAQAQGGNAVRAAQSAAPAMVSAAGQAAAESAAATRQGQLQTAQLGAQQQAMTQQADLQRASTAQAEQLAGQAAAQQLQLADADRQQKLQFTQDEIASQRRAQELGLETEARISFLTQAERESLAKLGADVKQELFDSRLQFERDEAGRKFSNDRQLADWTVASAQSAEQAADRMQTIQQTMEKEVKLMEAASRRLEQSIKNDFADAGRELDQASKQRIIQMQADLQKQIEKKKAKAAGLGNIIQGATGGAAAGAYFGPWGMVAGAAIGAGAAVAANKNA